MPTFILQPEWLMLASSMTISGWVFMILVGLNAAASARVSNELGAGHPKSAAFPVIVVTTCVCIISVIAALTILALRHVICYAFIRGEVVAEAVSDLCPLLALTLLLNGIQPVLSAVVVGYGWQTFVAYVSVGYYYIMGVPLGSLLGFYFKLGAKGIWSGMMGGTLMQTVILVWFTFRTDWNKETTQPDPVATDGQSISSVHTGDIEVDSQTFVGPDVTFYFPL